MNTIHKCVSTFIIVGKSVNKMIIILIAMAK